MEVMLKETPGSSSGRSCLDADVVEKMTGVETEVRPTKGETDPREGLRTTVSHHEACANTMVTRFFVLLESIALPQWTSLVCPAAPDPRDAAQPT